MSIFLQVIRRFLPRVWRLIRELGLLNTEDRGLSANADFARAIVYTNFEERSAHDYIITTDHKSTLFQPIPYDVLRVGDFCPFIIRF